MRIISYIGYFTLLFSLITEIKVNGQNVNTSSTQDLKVNQLESNTLLDSVFNYICNSQILNKDIVFRQAIWETGWFKGAFLMSKNNLFGFRTKNYMTFNSWQESIDYYENWQKRKYTNHQEDYYDFLVRIRFSNHRYPGHLKKMKIEKCCDCPKQTVQ